MPERRGDYIGMRCGQAMGAFALVLLGVANAARAAVPIRFTWTAPPGCPDRAAVLDRVADLVGRAPQSDEDLWFDAVVNPIEAGRWRVVLRSGWTGSASERRFESASCASIASATAFIIGMSVDPAGVAERATLETAARQERDARIEGPPPAPPESGARPALHLALGPRTTGDVGSLPKATLGAGGAVVLWQSRWMVDASGQIWLPRQTSNPTSGIGGEFGLWTGELRGCYAVATGGTRADLCVGGEAGWTEGIGTGIRFPAKARGRWGAVLAGVMLRPSASGPLGAWIGIDAGVPVAIPSYVIEGIGEVHRPWPVFARASMGVEFRVF